MKIAVSAKIFGKASLEAVIEMAAQIGYDGIELRSDPQQIPVDVLPDVVERAKKRAEDAGIAITSLASFTGFYADKDNEECKRQLEDFKRYVQVADKLGAFNVRHWPGPFGLPSANTTDAHYQRAAEWLAKACDYAAQYGVWAAIELHHNTMQDTTDSALKIHQMVGRKNLGFTPDNQNYFFDDEPYCDESIGRLGKERIINAHIKDVARLETNATPGSFEYRSRYYVFRPINEGSVDQYGYLRALNAAGFDRYATVESAFLLTPYELAVREYNEVVLMMSALGIKRG